MAYKSLKKIAYEAHNDQKTIKNEYDKRMKNYGVIKSGLHPYLKKDGQISDDLESFIIPLREIAMISERVEYNSAELSKNLGRLPKTAKKIYLIQELTNELKAGTALEGLKINEKDIESTITYFLADKNRQYEKNVSIPRTFYLVKSYFRLLNGDFPRIETIIDIRKIYDQLYRDFILDDNRPDGAFFRSRQLEVDFGGQGVKMTLPADEDDLENKIDHWLDFISDKNIPYLIKGSAAFGTFMDLSPFYQGNGLTARYIFSAYLTRKLDPLTGLNFSRQLLKNHESYSNSLQEFIDRRNFAEGSFLVRSILSIVENSQQDALERLSTAKERYLQNRKNIDRCLKKDDPQFYIFDQLNQAAAFSQNKKTLLDRQLIQSSLDSGYSKRALSRAIKELEDKKIITVIKKNPMEHQINLSF